MRFSNKYCSNFLYDEIFFQDIGVQEILQSDWSKSLLGIHLYNQSHLLKETKSICCL